MRGMVTAFLLSLIIAIGCVGIWYTEHHTFQEKLTIAVCSVFSAILYLLAEVIGNKHEED